MNYTRNGNLHRVVRITGPTHNLLGLEFGAKVDSCVVERLSTAVGGIDAEEVKAWVLAAVAKTNDEFQTNMEVRRIQYVPSDSPDPKAYEVMVRELMLRARSA